VNALFYLGESSYRLKEYDKAIDFYTRFISRSRPGNYLRCYAYEGLGYCHEEKQDYAAAVEGYGRSLQEQSNSLPDLLYVAIARCYEALNDKTKALDYYKKVTGDKKGSVLLTIAADRIASSRLTQAVASPDGFTAAAALANLSLLQFQIAFMPFSFVLEF